VLGGQELRHSPTVVVPNQVRSLRTEVIEKTQDDDWLAPQRPVRVPERLGVAEPQQVGCQATMGGAGGGTTFRETKDEKGRLCNRISGAPQPSS
jgi:hypothetical protein